MPIASIIRLLRQRADRLAIYGVLIAVSAVVCATVLHAWLAFDAVTPATLIAAQQTNPALWALDALPFVYALWGQHASATLAYEAGCLVLDQTDRIRIEKAALEHRALHDPLTDLPNRLLLRDRLAQAIRKARRYKSKVLLVYIDLNHFKRVNDQYGHTVGDQLLQQVSLHLHRSLRESDTVARLGGDEFAILSPETSRFDDADALANRVRQALATPILIRGHRFRIEASLGLALFPDHASTATQLLECADLAMYRAKQAGLPCVVYDDSLSQQDVRQLESTVGALRTVIEQRRFHVDLEPALDLRTGELASVRAVTHWDHPAMGAVQERHFLSMIEHTGLAQPYFLHALRTALLRYQQTFSHSKPPLRMRVPTAALLDDTLLEELQLLLKLEALSPGGLVLSFTEDDLLLAWRQNGLYLFDNLRRLGVALAVEEFAGNATALTKLADLPIDYGILSAALSERIQHGPDRLLRGLIGFCDALGWACILPGIDTTAAWDQARALGAHQAEGSYCAQRADLAPSDIRHAGRHAPAS